MLDKRLIPFGTRVTLTLILMIGMLGVQPAKFVLADTLTVTNTNDGGPGSLRQAIADAVSGDTITFDPALAGETITLSSQLEINKDLTIDGSRLTSQLVLSGGFTTRIIEITALAEVTISNISFTKGIVTNDSGGAINNRSGNLTVINSSFFDNSASGNGGAIYGLGGNITVIDSTFSRNMADGNGGAISTSVFEMNIVNTTITRNQANSDGGALDLAGNTFNTIVNSTVFKNQAGGRGGGIYLTGNTNARIFNSTFAGNTAVSGDELSLLGNVLLDLHNTIFVCSTASENCYIQALSTTIATNHSILGMGTLLDYGLAELADNGGATQTMALLPGSSLLNAGDDGVCANGFVNNFDQRGVTRPQGSHCDIGAYEDQSIVRYVKQDATGTNNGSSWENAYTDLQSALAAAVPDEEIWVAAGTYKPTSGTDRTISFTLKNGVAVYGGFAGNETNRAQRNYEANLTVLSGDIGVLGDTSDNSFHVLVGSDTNHSTILDGFTVTAGNANDIISSQHYLGGGMYIDKGNPQLNHLIFTDNYAGLGGGIYAFNTDINDHNIELILTNVVFRNNTVAGEGGGMATRFIPYSPLASFRLSLTDVTFENNSAGRTGGGLNNNGGELKLVNVIFSGNTAGGGGGLSHIPYTPSILTDVTFSNNFASEGGGGMLVGSGGILTTLTNVTFNNNSTPMNGGGIANASHSHLILTNVTFSNNTAGISGGGIFTGGVLNVGGGGTVSLLNATLSSNTANSNGSAVYNENGTINVHNSILYGTSGEEISGAANVTYSIVQGGYTGTGNIDADPLLGPLQDNGGFTQTMALGAGSPAIDSGDDTNCPEFDQRGVARPQGSHCDIGAYEFDGDATAPTVTSIIRTGASPTNAASVDFTVTFSELVSDVAANDFALHPTGNVSGATIQSVSGSGSVYTVTVNTGSGNGTLRLEVPASATITDLTDNPMTGLPFTSGESYTILKAATFSDVETDYWAWSFIERLVNAGITAGCGGGGYCPESPVTRAQMAVFLLRGIHGSSYAPPAVGNSTGFGDVPTNHWAGAWIKQLAAEGITSGCGNGNYCPELSVTRAQMAIFLLRAKHGQSYSPPAVGNSTGFGDVPAGHWAAAWIKQLVAEGITAGCGNNNYCSESPVTRAQMAVFLVRAFGIP